MLIYELWLDYLMVIDLGINANPTNIPQPIYKTQIPLQTARVQPSHLEQRLCEEPETVVDPVYLLSAISLSRDSCKSRGDRGRNTREAASSAERFSAAWDETAKKFGSRF